MPSSNHVAEMIYSRYHACAICIALAAAIGAAGQGSPSQNPSIAAASSDVQLITIDLSDTPFNSVQVFELLANRAARSSGSSHPSSASLTIYPPDI